MGYKINTFIISCEKNFLLSFFKIFLLLGNSCEIFESMKVEFLYLYMLYVDFFSIHKDSYIILSQILSRLLYLCWRLGPTKKNPFTIFKVDLLLHN